MNTYFFAKYANSTLVILKNKKNGPNSVEFSPVQNSMPVIIIYR